MYGWLKTGAAAVAVWALLPAPALAQESPPDSDPGAAAQEAAPAARLLVHSGLATATLQRQYPDRVRWLEPAQGDRFPALWFPEQRPDVSGALILMADEGSSAGAGLVVAMARVLAQSGWAVLTLGLEPLPASVRALLQNRRVPAAEDSAAPSVMIDVLDAPDPVLAQYQAQVRGQLLAALAWLAEQGYSSGVLAGIGHAAFYVLDTDPGVDRIRARVWVLPEFYGEHESGLAQRLATRKGEALLELYPSTEDESGRQRWVAARQAGFAGYARQPVAVTVPPQPEAAHVLANRILAWLQATVRP